MSLKNLWKSRFFTLAEDRLKKEFMEKQVIYLS
jgi:hypothetical protein